MNIWDIGIVLGIIVIALAPGIFWLWYFYKKDIWEPEPLSLLVKMYFLGMVALIIAFTCEDLVNRFYYGILLTVLVAPVAEELSKFFMVFQFVYKDREFDEPMDGIVYATATGLGFASLENIIYLLTQPSFSSFLVTGAVRAILSVPGHALFGVFWGYGLGIAKFRPPGRRLKVITIGLLLGITTHGIFNFLLEQSLVGFAILILIVIPCVWWITEERIHNALLAGKTLKKIWGVKKWKIEKKWKR